MREHEKDDVETVSDVTVTVLCCGIVVCVTTVVSVVAAPVMVVVKTEVDVD